MMFTTLRSKIIAGFGVLVAVHLVFTLWAVNQFSQQSHRSQSLASDLSFHASLLLRLSSISVAEYRSLYAPGPAGNGTQDNSALDARFQRTVQQGIERVARDTIFLASGEYDSIQSAHERFSTLSGRITVESEERLIPDVEVLYQTLTDRIEYAGERIRADVSNYQSGIVRANQSMLLTVSLASLIAAILGVLSGIVYSRWALHSIDRLRTAVLAVRHGELAQSIHITSADELGDLSFEFNRMIEELRRYQSMNLEAVLLERRRSDTVISSVSTPIVVYGSDGILLLINEPARRLFSISFDEVVEGAHVEKFIESRDLLDRLRVGPVHEESENESIRFQWSVEREGVPAFYNVTQHPLTQASGANESSSPGGTVLIFNDVTEFKKLDRLKSELLDRVSHELRTPVSSIVLATDLLSRGVVGDINEDQKDLLESMRNDLRRLGTMISELLESARIEHLELTDTPAPCDIDMAISEIVSEHSADAEVKRLSLSVQTDLSASTTFPILPEHLRLVLGNFISNAIRYSPVGEEVTISSSIDAEGFHVTVEDRGPGIPLAEQEKVFERFYQIERGTANPPGSVGLGLAMARDLILLYGGTILAESRPGAGSLFRFHIPHPSPIENANHG